MSNINHPFGINIILANSTASVLASVAKSLPEEVNCIIKMRLAQYQRKYQYKFTEILGMHLNQMYSSYSNIHS